MIYEDTLSYHLYRKVGFLVPSKSCVSDAHDSREYQARHDDTVVHLKILLYIPEKPEIDRVFWEESSFSSFFCLHLSDMTMKLCDNVFISMMKPKVKIPGSIENFTQ